MALSLKVLAVFITLKLKKVYLNVKQKEIFVIRPTRLVKVKRIEKDPNKLQEMYELGIEDAKNSLEKLNEYIKSN